MRAPRGAGASLRTRLVTALTLLVLVVAALAAVGSTLRARQEAAETQDDLLTRIAELAAVPDPSGTGDVASTGAGAGIVVEEISTGSGHDLPSALPDGLSTTITDDGPQRVAVRTLPDGRRLAAAQPIAVRDDAVRETVTSTLVPIVVAVPLLVLGSALVVSWALRPVESLRRELASRGGDELEPLPRDGVPAELTGFLDAVDTHHARAAGVLEGRRRFAAEAAHELRTPIAAVSFQAEHLLAAQDEEERQRRGRVLEGGLARLRTLADQLLVLGDESAPEDHRQSVEAVVRALAGDLLGTPEGARADLRFDLEAADGAHVPATAATTVLRNLVGNALRHAANSGPIEVRAVAVGEGVQLEVRDRGPGIQDPEQVLAPFHREAGQEVPGHGLGLAITVRTLERQGGSLELLPRPGGGTIARATLPRV
ncbi:ATP-binding protein [Brachybacterium horti]